MSKRFAHVPIATRPVFTSDSDSHHPQRAVLAAAAAVIQAAWRCHVSKIRSEVGWHPDMRPWPPRRGLFFIGHSGRRCDGHPALFSSMARPNRSPRLHSRQVCFHRRCRRSVPARPEGFSAARVSTALVDRGFVTQNRTVEQNCQNGPGVVWIAPSVFGRGIPRVSVPTRTRSSCPSDVTILLSAHLQASRDHRICRRRRTSEV